MTLSRPSNGEASGAASDPFFEDVETGIKKLINDAVSSRLAGKSDWVTLTPNPDLGKNICWCGEDEKHNFKNCSQRQSMKLQSPPTVSPDAALSHCPHRYDKINFMHNCFCFQIASTMKLFYQFFLRPRILAILSPGYKFPDSDPVQKLGPVQEEALWASTDAKHKVLARFLTDMRREDIVTEAEKESSCPWHIERVHAVLGWRDRGVDACVADLKKAMDEASRYRTSMYKSVHECIVEEDISFY